MRLFPLVFISWFLIGNASAAQYCHHGQYGGVTCFSTLANCQSQVRSFGGACTVQSGPSGTTGGNRDVGAMVRENTNSVLDSFYRAQENQRAQEQHEADLRQRRLEQELLRQSVRNQNNQKAAGSLPTANESGEAECARAAKYLIEQDMEDAAIKLMKNCNEN